MQTLANDNSPATATQASAAPTSRRLSTYLAALLWAGLVLRDARLRVLLPLRRDS